MTQYVQLTKRNLLMYLRDRGTVFFSLLSMFVVLCLMIFFLGDINISVLTSELSRLPGRDAQADKENALLLVLTWTTGGIVPVNAVMVTLSSYSSMIRDKRSRRSDAIYTSPVSRTVVALSYITATCLASIIICTLTFVIAEVYFVIKGASVLSFIAHLKIFLMIVVNSFSYSAIMYLFAALVRTESAWSGFGTVIGALVGFFGGIYMPIGQLAPTLVSIVKSTPVIYSTVMFRQVICKDMLEVIFDGVPEVVVDIYKETMGITIEIWDVNVSPLACCAILLISGVIFLTAGMIVIEQRRKKGNK